MVMDSNEAFVLVNPVSLEMMLRHVRRHLLSMANLVSSSGFNIGLGAFVLTWGDRLISLGDSS
jgi:hypothetical protein